MNISTSNERIAFTSQARDAEYKKLDASFNPDNSKAEILEKIPEHVGVSTIDPEDLSSVVDLHRRAKLYQTHTQGEWKDESDSEFWGHCVPYTKIEKFANGLLLTDPENAVWRVVDRVHKNDFTLFFVRRMHELKILIRGTDFSNINSTVANLGEFAGKEVVDRNKSEVFEKFKELSEGITTVTIHGHSQGAASSAYLTTLLLKKIAKTEKITISHFACKIWCVPGVTTWLTDKFANVAKALEGRCVIDVLQCFHAQEVNLFKNCLQQFFSFCAHHKFTNPWVSDPVGQVGETWLGHNLTAQNVNLQARVFYIPQGEMLHSAYIFENRDMTEITLAHKVEDFRSYKSEIYFKSKYQWFFKKLRSDSVGDLELMRQLYALTKAPGFTLPDTVSSEEEEEAALKEKWESLENQLKVVDPKMQNLCNSSFFRSCTYWDQAVFGIILPALKGIAHKLLYKNTTDPAIPAEALGVVQE